MPSLYMPDDPGWQRAFGRCPQKAIKMPSKNVTPFIVRGRKVRVNENGLVCLNDIHLAAGFSKNQKPNLVYVMAGEQLAAERIGYEDRRGVNECSVATTKSASFIRQAIEADRADRRKPAP
jgi:hypothetical protein